MGTDNPMSKRDDYTAYAAELLDLASRAASTLGSTNTSGRGPSAPHPPSRARLVALGMTPSSLPSEPSNNGATNTPMTADQIGHFHGEVPSWEKALLCR